MFGSIILRMARVSRTLAGVSRTQGRVNLVKGASFSSTSSHHSIYELRTYNIKPDTTQAFVKLCKEKMHIRLSYSKLIGYWMTEIGGVSEAVHLWEYDSLHHRASVRTALSQDSGWIDDFLSKAIHYFAIQHNDLVTVPWGTVEKTPLKVGGVYQLVAMETKSGCSKSILDKVKALTSIQQSLLEEKQTGKLIGVFTTQVGACNTVYQLWNYLEINDLLSCKEAMNEHPSSEGQEEFLNKVTTKMLIPVPGVSPLM